MTRDRLPSRRRNETTTARLRFRAPGDSLALPPSEHEFHVTIGFYEDGRPGEVFVKASQNLDSAMAFMLEDVAVLISWMLQNGASLQMIRDMVARPVDVAASIVAALLDYVARFEPLPPAPMASRLANGELKHPTAPQLRAARTEVLTPRNPKR